MTDIMRMAEEKMLNELSASEKKVYQYIKEESFNRGGRIKESMSSIGEQVGLSGVTVHRAVSKLKKNGIVAIEPSAEKAESNEIVFFGFMDPNQQANNIIQIISSLSSNANRFQSILEVKDTMLDEKNREITKLYKKIVELETELKEQKLLSEGFDNANIISKQDLGDGKIAYLIQT